MSICEGVVLLRAVIEDRMMMLMMLVVVAMSECVPESVVDGCSFRLGEDDLLVEWMRGLRRNWRRGMEVVTSS